MRPGCARLDRLTTTVMLALAVWVCALPLVLLLVVPRIGIWQGIYIATGLLAGIVLLCWALSVPGGARPGSRPAPESPGGAHGPLESATLQPRSRPDAPRFTVVVSPDCPDAREELARLLSGENVRVVLGPAPEKSDAAHPAVWTDVCARRRDDPGRRDVEQRLEGQPWAA